MFGGDLGDLIIQATNDGKHLNYKVAPATKIDAREVIVWAHYVIFYFTFGKTTPLYYMQGIMRMLTYLQVLLIRKVLLSAGSSKFRNYYLIIF